MIQIPTAIFELQAAINFKQSHEAPPHHPKNKDALQTRFWLSNPLMHCGPEDHMQILHELCLSGNNGQRYDHGEPT